MDRHVHMGWKEEWTLEEIEASLEVRLAKGRELEAGRENGKG
jgi:hypothetical protein